MRENCQTIMSDETPHLYDLYGVSNHFGTLNGGHYTATVKNFVSGQWHYMNDSSCTDVSEDQVITPASYMLFYRRRDL